jgi:adenylate cyclase class 2
MIETEIKIRIKDIDSTIESLLQQGAHLENDRYLEENTLYDFPSQLLYKKGQALRIRRINKKTFLAFKGAPQKSRKFKIREEFETEVKNEKQLKKILKSLDLSPAFQYKKFRRVFRKKRLKICLDETPVGNFLELEGKREDIVKAAKSLGFSKKEFIKSDYIQLLKESKKSKYP